MPVAFRPLAATLAVGTLVGLVVAGGGSRLAMGVIARADDREDFGSITESQAVVGEITTAGTVDVLVAGMGLGIVGAFGYLGLRRWLPTGPVSAALVYAAVTLGVGLLLTVEGNRGDFVFLDTAVSLLSFAAVLLLYALALPPLVERLAPRDARRSRRGHAVVAGVLALSLIAGAFAVKEAMDLADQNVQLTALPQIRGLSG